MLEDVELVEVSLVAVPMQPRARVHDLFDLKDTRNGQAGIPRPL